MRARGPGRRSLEGLGWLARVGASSGETWARAMGWQGSTVRSHALRLEQSGLVVRVARLTGGPLIYPTRLGVDLTGVDAVALRRAPAPYTWPHHEACAEMAAYLTIRGREMLAPRELLVDDRWAGELEWSEHGELRRRGHRPDLVARLDGGWMAIEMELTAKSPRRLRAVLGLYADWLSEGRLDSILYVVGGERERRQLAREAPAADLGVGGGRFGLQSVAELQARLSEVAR